MTFDEYNKMFHNMKHSYLNGDLVETSHNSKIIKHWEESVRAGANPHLKILPESARDLDVFQRLDDSYRLQLSFFDEYYKDSNHALDNLGCVKVYLDANFTIYYKSGNRVLMDALKTKGIRIGSNLSISNIGVFAGNIDVKTPYKNVITLGAAHFCDLLSDFGCIARYCQSEEYPSLVSNQVIFFPLSSYTKSLKASLEFMLETEGATHSSYEQSIKWPKLQQRVRLLEKSAFYSMECELLIDAYGKIAFFNKYFEKEFGKIATSTDIDLVDFLPELSSIKDNLTTMTNFQMREFRLTNHTGKISNYYVNCMIMKENGNVIGAKITLKPAKELRRIVAHTSYQNAFFNFDDILGESPAMLNAKEYAKKAAKTSSNIIITGESGTGKELFAQAIHNASEFSTGPFIPINCGAIPKELIGTELFGYVGGAFTGANRGGSPGKIEMADGGTLFLDEVGELSLDMQVYLLRFLETGVISRIGSSDFIPVNVRVVCATNRDLTKIISQGLFREDLYYRLNVISISLPPLRERRKDILILAQYYVKLLSEKNHKFISGIPSSVMRQLNSYNWPGNIRELRNTIERSVLETPEGSPLVLALENESNIASSELINSTLPTSDKRIPHYKEYEEQRIRQLMLKYNGNKSAVASAMGISRSTLYKKLKDIGYS